MSTIKPCSIRIPMKMRRKQTRLKADIFFSDVTFPNQIIGLQMNKDNAV